MKYRIEFNQKQDLTIGEIRSLIEKTFNGSYVTLETIAWDKEQSREYAIIEAKFEEVPVEFLESSVHKNLWVEKIQKCS